MSLQQASSLLTNEVILTLFLVYIYIQHLTTRILLNLSKPRSKIIKVLEGLITVGTVGLIGVIWF